jgi:hypothetical protein
MDYRIAQFDTFFAMNDKRLLKLFFGERGLSSNMAPRLFPSINPDPSAIKRDELTSRRFFKINI